MSKPIRIIVRGTDNAGDDAPTVEDLLSQIQDQVSIFQDVESEIDNSGSGQISWRVTNVSKNSPITFEVTPYPKNHGVNVDSRAEVVIETVANGFEQILEGRGRPKYFSDQVFKKIEKISTRLENGLVGTDLDFSEYKNCPKLNLDTVRARKVTAQTKAILQPSETPHREIGSVEGYITKVELDGFNRPIVWLKTRLDKQIIKCVSKEGGLEKIGHIEVSEVLQGLRVKVFGIINYRSLEGISSINVSNVDVFDSDEKLPDYEDIVDPNFTGGVESVEYLRALRKDA